MNTQPVQKENNEQNQTEHFNEQIHKFLFASLKPNNQEFAELNYIFSPFDLVELENTSKYPIQITGNFSQISDGEEDMEEDGEEGKDDGEQDQNDEKENELNLNDLQKKVADFMKQKGLNN